MTPKETARQWAKENPDFRGILGVEANTARGKGGRLGSKTTTYKFVVVNGMSTRATAKAGYFNGTCYVTGETYLECVLRWFHLPVSDGGRGNFVTTDATAGQIGATVGMNNEGEGGWLHPIYRRIAFFDAFTNQL